MLVAFALARGRFVGRFLLDALVNLPLVLPPVVIGWLLLLLLGRHGPLGAWLYAAFGLRLAFTTAGASLACGVMIFPQMVRACRQGLDAVDRGLEQAARTLGATPLDCFLSVTLPLAAPGVLVAAIAGYVAALGEFGAVITFAANIPGETETLPLAIFSALQIPNGETLAARLAMVSVALALAGLGLSEWAGRRLGQRLGLR